MPSSKAPTKRAAPEHATNNDAKQQKATESNGLDDLFAEAEVVAPKIVNKTATKSTAE